MYFLGSDDFSAEARGAAVAAIGGALERGWPGFEIAERLPLESIAAAHARVEQGRPGRVALTLGVS